MMQISEEPYTSPLSLKTGVLPNSTQVFGTDVSLSSATNYKVYIAYLDTDLSTQLTTEADNILNDVSGISKYQSVEVGVFTTNSAVTFSMNGFSITTSSTSDTQTDFTIDTFDSTKSDEHTIVVEPIVYSPPVERMYPQLQLIAFTFNLLVLLMNHKQVVGQV